MKKYISLLLLLSMIHTTTIPMFGQKLLDSSEDSSTSSSEASLSDEAIKTDPVTEQINALIRKKRIYDVLQAGLATGMMVGTICNAIWEEPSLHSDYGGATAFSVGNKMNTCISVGLGIADLAWLINPYCGFFKEGSEEDHWSLGMKWTHGISCHVRSVVATAVTVGAGIYRYPRTLSMLYATAFVDLCGMVNAANHEDTAQKISNLLMKNQ